MSRSACWLGEMEGGGRTESDRKVEDEATPQHAGDGLDGHFESVCGCEWRCCGLLMV